MSNDFIQNAVNALYQSNELMALKAELANLKAKADQSEAENASLKAEVERLTYVGDAMAMMVGHIEVTGDAHRMMLEFSKEWEAAKGVQS